MGGRGFLIIKNRSGLCRTRPGRVSGHPHKPVRTDQGSGSGFLNTWRKAHSGSPVRCGQSLGMFQAGGYPAEGGRVGEAGLPERRRKLSSLCPLPVEPVNPCARTAAFSPLVLAETGCRCAILKPPKSWKFAARRRGVKGVVAGQEACKSWARSPVQKLVPKTRFTGLKDTLVLYLV